MPQSPRANFWRKTMLIAAATFVWAPSAFATYDTNLTGVPDGIYTYPSGLLLIHMPNQLSSHPSCNPNYFALDSTSVPDAGAMSRMYARVIAAHAMQEPISIGYDGQGDCVEGYIHVWRIG